MPERPAEHPEAHKRYNLVIPAVLFHEVQALATHRQVSVLELLRRFIRLGLLVARAEETPQTAFVLREGSRERELLLL
jgi:hypothetical protein